jgi:NitT/TauT family transport system ATP-binding protein
MQVVIHALEHTFPGKPPRHALNELSIDIPSGTFTAVVGPSGCGKSTLLRLVAGLLSPQTGKVRLNGKPVTDPAIARKVAWMSQSPALMPWLTARANVALAQRFHTNGHPLRLSPDEALQRVGLADATGAYPFMLSGGMQQRLALARTLTIDAELWLMDEPFAALDELTRERLTHELAQLWEPLRPTVLWVTHNIYEALRLADRVLVFSQQPGRLIADIPVSLPRPRIESDVEYQRLLAALRTALGLNDGGMR